MRISTSHRDLLQLLLLTAAKAITAGIEDVVEAPIEAVAVVEALSTAHMMQSHVAKRKRAATLAGETSVDGTDNDLRYETVLAPWP